MLRPSLSLLSILLLLAPAASARDEYRLPVVHPPATGKTDLAPVGSELREVQELSRRQRRKHPEAPPLLVEVLDEQGRPAGGALHPPVEPAIPQIIDHAPGGACRHRADQEQQHQLAHPCGIGGHHGNDPPAWQQQQPPADRPVEAPQQNIGMNPFGQPPPQSMRVYVRVAAPLGVNSFGRGFRRPFHAHHP